MKRAAPIKKKKSILLRVAFFAFCVYAVVTLVQLQYDLLSDKQELAQLEKQVLEQQNKNDELERLMESGSEEKFIERAARDKFGYVYEDEQVFTDISGKLGS